MGLQPTALSLSAIGSWFCQLPRLDSNQNGRLNRALCCRYITGDQGADSAGIEPTGL